MLNRHDRFDFNLSKYFIIILEKQNSCSFTHGPVNHLFLLMLAQV